MNRLPLAASPLPKYARLSMRSRLICWSNWSVGSRYGPSHSVIGPSGSLLLIGRVVIAGQPPVDMARHVPHVGNRWGRGPAEGRRWQGQLRLLVVPEMNAVMMHGVQRIALEHLANERINGGVA